MREIKFRAWDNKLNKYTDVFLEFRIWNGVLEYLDDIMNIKKRVVIEQYTGLKDFNGVEIFENDIIQTHVMTPGDEKYVDAVPTGVVKYYEGAYWIDNNNSALRLFQESIQIVVIGNIHEQPELLEDK